MHRPLLALAVLLRSTSLGSLAPRAALATFAALTLAGSSHASVVWTFSQEGNDVLAVASGTWLYGQARIGSSNWQNSQVGAGDFYLFAMSVPSGTLVTEGFLPQGGTTSFAFGSSPDTGTGTFGHIGARVYTSPTFVDGSAIEATLTWFNTTLDEVLGVGVALPGQPRNLFFEDPFINGGNQTISLVRAVPEPGAPVLVIAGLAFGLFARRRRPQTQPAAVPPSL